MLIIIYEAYKAPVSTMCSMTLYTKETVVILRDCLTRII